MSKGHDHRHGGFTVHYESLGVYRLAFASGERFASFEDFLGRTGYRFSIWANSAYDRVAAFRGRDPHAVVRHGDFRFRFDTGSVSASVRNLAPVPEDARAVFRSIHAEYSGEFRFVGACGLRMEAAEVHRGLMAVARERYDANRSRPFFWRGRFYPDTSEHEEFRKSPVKNTGRRRRYRWERGRPPVFKDVAYADFGDRFDEDCLEHGIRTRAKRGRRRLEKFMEYRNDHPSRSTDGNRSWKRHRARQWK